jgi:glycosyltransferase involved in cell wall biosynthesis
LVPEKGADLAVAAARAAGWPLQLAGPIVDSGWFEAKVAPHLSDTVRYLGHLDQAQLSAAIGAASATLVTPRWDEPYGLVVAESLACGTPVVAFARGGIPEIVDEQSAVLVAGGDVAGMAAAIPAAVALDRDACRRRATRACSIEAMVDRYEDIYRQLLPA